MSSQAVTRPEYTPAVIETCLRVMALCGGNSLEAERQLAGTNVLERVPSASVMRDWRLYDHKDRYLELCDTVGPELERIATSLTRENLVNLAAKVNEGIRTIDFEDLNPTDRARAVQQLSIAQGVQQDKLMTLTNRPQSITAHQDLDDVLRELNTLAPGAVGYDAVTTADEIPPAPSPAALKTDSDKPNARDLAA